MMLADLASAHTQGRSALDAWYRADEAVVLGALLEALDFPKDARERTQAKAAKLVADIRQRRHGHGSLDAFLNEYSLSSDEGVVLMCLAEALLRVPDAHTAHRLIHDKLATADWEEHLGHSQSVLVNASTWALMLTGRLVGLQDYREESVGTIVGRLVSHLGEPIVRQAVTQSMRIMGHQFVMGRTIEEALQRAAADTERGFRHSFDMLGEAACTSEDARAYYEAYAAAIDAIAKAGDGLGPVAGPGISVKLSALHPRYEFSQRPRVLRELLPRLRKLVARAVAGNIGLTVDAEEADRLDLSLDLVETLCADPALANWQGLGVVVQAYQKRALPLLDWLAALARKRGQRLMVRLVKGAYWDTEIKRAQERGLDGYPVFTRKTNTDVCYLACAQRLLGHSAYLYPQFATHNAHTAAAMIEMAGEEPEMEFQRLHGMGEALYDRLAADTGIPCRIYAPVGQHADLLPYLVRRLLENGSNTSFVDRSVDDAAPIDEIVADPVARAESLATIPHPRIPLPDHLYQSDRLNSRGVDLSDRVQLQALAGEMRAADDAVPVARPMVSGEELEGEPRTIHNPFDRRQIVGSICETTDKTVQAALAAATEAAPMWANTGAEERAATLETMADILEQERADFMGLLVREAGKTIDDAHNEVRESVDFCRYYAGLCRAEFSTPRELVGPTGESNQLIRRGRGVFACISPWNFPLAIFTGQVAAALAAGNAVIAKPAEQTPLVAALAVRRFLQAGIPASALHLLPGDGGRVGAALVGDARIAGVAFTGSVETARSIQRSLAQRDGAIVPFIAETGGLNAMVVDSSALPEQVVADVITSAFRSAGQRCSALRVLFLQDDIANKVLTMLQGAMTELTIGDPALLATDVGPVIDADALETLNNHAARMQRAGRRIYQCKLPDSCGHGSFFPPTAYEVDNIQVIGGEVFGPILHVVRFDGRALDSVADAINDTGFGLTAAIHSRLDSTISRLQERLRAGNLYINRNQTGAVVGVQPFGGEGLSGTGPKAGGPDYLHRFALERTVTINTTAQGGNPALLNLQ
ncbi:MAG: bifunctional proline dehydrogenase/L-glutamate gamma-semialdehyde dehydrogenase, partial [Gammaproteobacteria bacterium]